MCTFLVDRLSKPSLLTAVLVVILLLVTSVRAANPDNAPYWDTIYCDDGSKAQALALIVGADGNLGKRGEGKVNLDYFNYGDCAWYDEDDEKNPYLGDPRVYLYEASPVVLWDDAGSKVAEYSMFNRYPGGGGFAPGPDPEETVPDWLNNSWPIDADITRHVFFARDSAIEIDQVTMAPNVDNPSFMIQMTRFTNLTDHDLTGLAFGEAIDWDIPSDSGRWNGDGYDPSRHLMYQVGEEYGQDTIECQRNDSRAGGIAVLKIYEDGVSSEPEYGMYTMDNATQVYPLGDFHPDSLWLHMQNKTGFNTADSSQFNDLHMVATYRWNHTLAAEGGNLTVYTVLATSYGGGPMVLSYSVDLAREWLNQYPPPCCRYVGDINHDGADGGDPPDR